MNGFYNVRRPSFFQVLVELESMLQPADPPKPEELRIPCSAWAHVVKEGMHKHRCPNCETVWKHANDLPQRCSEAQNELAHTCPECGTIEYFKFGKFC